MKRIISVWGPACCGKSTCINFLRELLRASGESKSNNPPYSGDKCETFRYNDQIICVCPGGDTKEIIDDNFKYALSKNADVIITASRSKGSPRGKVREWAKIIGVQVKWLRKSIEYGLSKSTNELCNREYAQMIFDLL